MSEKPFQLRVKVLGFISITGVRKHYALLAKNILSDDS